jgi:hypothetical protein
MKVMVNSSVPKLLAVANYSVKVAFRRRYKICVVHEHGAWKVLPTHVAILHE